MCVSTETITSVLRLDDFDYYRRYRSKEKQNATEIALRSVCLSLGCLMISLHSYVGTGCWFGDVSWTKIKSRKHNRGNWYQHEIGYYSSELT